MKSIKVFISSTFKDMQKERDYLNRHIFPGINMEAKKRGVSFYAVDLRWGITESQSQRKKTIELCLNEVQRCIPFFIGIIGNRYGWIPGIDDLDETTKKWYDPASQFSATELEFTYYCKNVASTDNCFFALKSKSLFQEKDFDNHEDKTSHFIKRIQQKQKDLFVYNSVEELGEKVFQVINSWLDKHFPNCSIEEEICQYKDDLKEQQQEHNLLGSWQQQELSKAKVVSNYEYDPYKFLYAGDSYQAHEAFCHHIIGVRFHQLCLIEAPGCEKLCNRHFEYLKQELESYHNSDCITIYLDASEKLRSPYQLMFRLLIELRKIYGGTSPKSSYQSIDEIKQWISYTLNHDKKERDLYICLLNLHQIDSSVPDYDLLFLNNLFGDDIHFIISTSDRSQASVLAACGELVVRSFPIRNFNSMSQNTIIARLLIELNHFGKTIDPEYVESLNRLLNYRDRITDEEMYMLGHFLINYTVFDTITITLENLLFDIEQGRRISSSIWNMQIRKMNRRTQDIVYRILYILNTFPIYEDQLFYILARGSDINKIEFSECFEIAFPFLKVSTSGYKTMILCTEIQNAINQGKNDTDTRTIAEILFDKIRNEFYPDKLQFAYELKKLILETESTELGEAFIRSGSIINLSREYDVHLAREVWIMLVKKEKEAFDVKRIFSDYFSDEGFGRYGYFDLIMKIEWSLFGYSIVEDYLDIPGFYSVFLEEQWIDKCQFEERQILFHLLKMKEEDRVGQEYYRYLLQLADEAKEDGTTNFRMYILEYLLRFKRQNHIEINDDEIGYYLALALYGQNRRIIADAFSHYIENGNYTPDNLKALHRLYFSNDY